MAEVLVGAEDDRQRLDDQVRTGLELSLISNVVDGAVDRGFKQHWHKDSESVGNHSDQLVHSLGFVALRLLVFKRTGESKAGCVGPLKSELHQELQSGIMIVLVQNRVCIFLEHLIVILVSPFLDKSLFAEALEGLVSSDHVVRVEHGCLVDAREVVQIVVEGRQLVPVTQPIVVLKFLRVQQ